MAVALESQASEPYRMLNEGGWLPGDTRGNDQDDQPSLDKSE